MRILSVTARNYRLHQDLTIELDPSRNLIGGPNETGKSTLAEAMHRAMFCRHRTGGELQQSMRSEIYNGQPEVRLVFETSGGSWTLDKRFSGTSGTIRLASNDGTSWQGDEAEDKLAQLVGNPDGATNRLNELSTRWAHLWVWQGTSGSDALIHAAKRKDELIQRLQQQGLAAVMQSPTDERVRESIKKSYDEIFNRNATTKANSKLDLANKQLAAAEASQARALEQQQRLRSAIEQHDAAAQCLTDSTAALPGLRAQLAAVNTSLGRVHDLSAREEMETFQHRNAVALCGELAKTDAQIRNLRQRAATAAESLQPAEAKLAALTQQETSARDTATAADLAQRAVSEAARQARQLHDLAVACVSHFEKSAVVADLTARHNAAAGITEALTADREALSKLPSINDAQLSSLRKLDERVRLAEGALQAIAAGVELVVSDQPVLLDGVPLTSGEARVITEAAELSLGSGTRLRIRPGGGTSLKEARNKLDSARQQLAHGLDELTVRDLADAVDILAKRQVIEKRIENIETKLRASGAMELPAALSAATADQLAAAAAVERRQAALTSPLDQGLPQSLDSARAWLATSSNAFEQSERNEDQLRRDADTRRDQHQRAIRALHTCQEAIGTARRELATLEVSASALEENFGDIATRQQALADAKAAETTAKAALDVTTRALAELNPQLLTSDLARFTRSISAEVDKQREAETQIAVTRNILALDGSSDPDAEVLQANARLATIQEEQAREQRRANAIALLHRLFTESQTAISESLTQPIAERVAGYLECIFGRGVQVRVDLSNTNNPSLSLTRPGSPAFAFDSLSGGAKEQVAAAVRLATAEILASNYDGCLPLVFDDAFAYADPERVQALQRMLDLAATRGLQVIVLTCTPSDYIGLGARNIRLSASPG